MTIVTSFDADKIWRLGGVKERVVGILRSGIRPVKYRCLNEIASMVNTLGGLPESRRKSPTCVWRYNV